VAENNNGNERRILARLIDRAIIAVIAALVALLSWCMQIIGGKDGGN
jgi:uncharacterized RDD family membrane protein YckC